MLKGYPMFDKFYISEKDYYLKECRREVAVQNLAITVAGYTVSSILLLCALNKVIGIIIAHDFESIVQGITFSMLCIACFIAVSWYRSHVILKMVRPVEHDEYKMYRAIVTDVFREFTGENKGVSDSDTPKSNLGCYISTDTDEKLQAVTLHNFLSMVVGEEICIVIIGDKKYAFNPEARYSDFDFSERIIL